MKGYKIILSYKNKICYYFTKSSVEVFSEEWVQNIPIIKSIELIDYNDDLLKGLILVYKSKNLQDKQIYHYANDNDSISLMKDF